MIMPMDPEKIFLNVQNKIHEITKEIKGFPGGSAVKNPPATQ